MSRATDCDYRKAHGWCSYEHSWCAIQHVMWGGEHWCWKERNDAKLRTCPLCAGTGKEHDGDAWVQTPCACQEK